MKGDQWVNIAFSCNGPVKNNGAEGEDDSGYKAPDIENSSADQDDDTHKFHGVAKFKTGLGVIGDGDKSHVQHGLGVKPSGFYSIFSQYDTSDNTQWRGEHIWSVHRGQTQAVNSKFKDQKLSDQRNVTGI